MTINGAPVTADDEDGSEPAPLTRAEQIELLKKNWPDYVEGVRQANLGQPERVINILLNKIVKLDQQVNENRSFPERIGDELYVEGVKHEKTFMEKYVKQDRRSMSIKDEHQEEFKRRGCEKIEAFCNEIGANFEPYREFIEGMSVRPSVYANAIRQRRLADLVDSL